jgi:hypothetical protein
MAAHVALVRACVGVDRGERRQRVGRDGGAEEQLHLALVQDVVGLARHRDERRDLRPLGRANRLDVTHQDVTHMEACGAADPEDRLERREGQRRERRGHHCPERVTSGCPWT